MSLSMNRRLQMRKASILPKSNVHCPWTIDPIKKAPPESGRAFLYLALWVLVTQLTVVSEENKQVGCTDCAIFVEVFCTTVW